MRVVYLTSVLLAVLISSLATINADVNQDKNPPVEQTTVANPKPITTVGNSTQNASATTHVPNATTDHISTDTTVVTDQPKPTTSQPTTKVTTQSSTTILTSTKEPSTTQKPTAPTTTAPVTVTSNTGSSVPEFATTAGPPVGPPTAAPDSKERHFDGLSFLGGIILATCLMAIGAFSWKFYKTYDERNYRTL